MPGMANVAGAPVMASIEQVDAPHDAREACNGQPVGVHAVYRMRAPTRATRRGPLTDVGSSEGSGVITSGPESEQEFDLLGFTPFECA